MPFQRKRSDLHLSDEEQSKLKSISTSRTEPMGRVNRAFYLLDYFTGSSICSIAKRRNVSRPTVERCIDKALACGIDVALKDLHRSGRPALIDDEARAWVIDLACKKPKDIGYAAELWTIRELANHIKKICVEAGYPILKNASKSLVHGILKANSVKPHKIKYYLEKRDVEFDTKMAQVLMVYKTVALELEHNTAIGKEDRQWTVVSYDEKPGIQAIGLVAPDLSPVPGSHETWQRDYEYKRLGTMSLLAGIDLLDGQIVGIVRERHRSAEFIEVLDLLHQKYPASWCIRVILDNHSAHISKETMKWLKDYPNRFEFVFTPKHGSWLNLIESFFSKMTRSMLRGIRVNSKAELTDRILKYLEEINEYPTVFKWKYKLDEIAI